MAYDNKLTGTLSRNDRKRPDKKDPDFSGQCEMEDGKQYWISGWIKEAGPQSKTPGRKFFSLSFKPKDPKPDAGAQAARPSRGGTTQTQGNLDDDVAF